MTLSTNKRTWSEISFELDREVPISGIRPGGRILLAVVQTGWMGGGGGSRAIQRDIQVLHRHRDELFLRI